jgi:hypothetical protein
MNPLVLFLFIVFLVGCAILAYYIVKDINEGDFEP